MGLPNINISFQTAASSAIERSQKGIVGIIIKDAAENGAHILTKTSQIPATLSADNKAYIERAFLGYVTPPKKVIVYVLATAAEDLSDALEYMAAQVIDYLAGPPDIVTDEITEIDTWIEDQRELGFIPKAVLPNSASDSEGIINFASEGIMIGSVEYTAAEYCSRIAGLLAGTPINISCTYAPLPEVTNVTQLTKDAIDASIDAGEFVIFHDGVKTKVGRGVNSLVTTTATKGAAFKKIKIVEAVDMIRRDISVTAQDTYIGKYANSYDNKCLLISAIRTYFAQLEREGVLAAGKNTADIDVDAQENYLISKSVDTSEMTEQEIKEANTDDKVYLLATISILDAIEDITLSIAI
jgi:hypothetical protein